jgi:hypothetical protein
MYSQTYHKKEEDEEEEDEERDVHSHFRFPCLLHLA